MPMADFVEIKNARDAASSDLARYEADLLTVFNPLRNKLINGVPLTPAEKRDFDQLGPALDEVHHAMVTLALITLQAINQSHEVRDIVNSLNGITGDLQETADRLTAIENATAAVAAVLSSIASVLATLAPLLAAA
jgi:hypothetical protein